MAKDVRLKVYPAIIGVLSACLLALLLSRFDVKVWTEQAPDSSSVKPDSSESPLPPAATPAPPSASASAVPSATPPAASPSPQPSPIASSSNAAPASTGSRAGGLRVSNQSTYPVRVALLPQQQDKAGATGASTAFTQPVHWDFAPGEGSAKGLLLSLPDANLRLHEGDVLMAFAQDGSGRYWGPYVVGKTSAPEWNAESKQWRLILQP